MAKHTEPTTPTYQLTREDWLHRAADMLSDLILQVSGIKLPEFHVSMGFGGLSYEKGVRGVCWHTSVSADAKNHVFISPELEDTGVVLAVLLHELIHVALNNEDGHRKRFAEFATRLGMEAPFTTARPDISLTAELMTIAAELGEFPHGKLTVPARRTAGQPVPVGGPSGWVSSAPAPQTNRWVSFVCPVHAGPIRLSRGKAARGAPFCGERGEDGTPCLMETVAR